MIAVRKANFENRKLEIDWIALGRQFNWDKRKTNNSFYILQSAVLDKWPKETIKKVQDEIEKLWARYKDKSYIQSYLDEKFQIKQSFQLDPKQINNAIDYKLRRLQQQDQRYSIEEHTQ